MRGVGATDLERIRDAWALGDEELAQACGTDVADMHTWLAHGVPEHQASTLEDLLTATVLLVAHVREERVADVVRRAAPAMGGRSLLELALAHRHEEVRKAVKDMFDLRRVQP